MENPSVFDVSSSDSASSSSSSWLTGKRIRANEEEEITSENKKNKFVLPPGFLEPLSSCKEVEILAPTPLSSRKADDDDPSTTQLLCVPYSKQFWKAGDYDEDSSLLGCGGDTTLIDGMDHVRVHPRFLHSNATSHKWVLGAVAELLDNSLDEANNGGTYCNIDMLLNKKDSSRMLLVEDNGGGMSPGTMRHCMSLGYSAKSKLTNTIGQYGNGFKTSTMRVGADVIVFSRCPGKDGGSPTQSIGLLSYTFLTSTGKEDIVVPMLDYEKNGKDWRRIAQASSTSADWNKNVETIVQWSPYASEADLLEQFSFINTQGTRIIIYNLWEDEEGALELDFDSDIHDIQIRGANRDEEKIQMAKDYPKSKQFLTYTHSLRSYSSILYLKPPPGFRIILRGRDVVHHNIVNNMFKLESIRYRPSGLDCAAVSKKGVLGKLGFHKDAKAHLDIQGFNVYHRNRLIKPFWRVWNTPSSGGRGVIGVLEANFVKPAHDKQDFEQTVVLSRLELKLADIQKKYWNKNKGAIGYVDNSKRKKSPSTSGSGKARCSQSNSNSPAKEIAVPVLERCDSLVIHSESTRRATLRSALSPAECVKTRRRSAQTGEVKAGNGDKNHEGKRKESGVTDSAATSGNNLITRNLEWKNKRKRNEIISSDLMNERDGATALEDQTNEDRQADAALLHQLQVENHELKDRLKELEEKHLQDLQLQEDKCGSLEAQHLQDWELQEEKHRSWEAQHLQDLELQKEKCRSLEAQHLQDLEKCRLLEAQLKEANDNFQVLDSEQDTLIDIFSEERTRRDAEEEKLMNKLEDASNTIQELQDKLYNLSEERTRQDAEAEKLMLKLKDASNTIQELQGKVSNFGWEKSESIR